MTTLAWPTAFSPTDGQHAGSSGSRKPAAPAEALRLLASVPANERMTDLAQATATRPIDVSVTVRPEMPIYVGDPGVTVELAKSIPGGDPANVSHLTLGAHTGTHVDAPRHFIPKGESASQLPLEPFIGSCA